MFIHLIAPSVPWELSPTEKMLKVHVEGHVGTSHRTFGVKEKSAI